MAHDIFIAHSGKDRNITAEISRHLKNAGVSCWVFPEDVKASEDVTEAIFAAMSGCKIVLLIFSFHTSDSIHIAKEVEFAVCKGKTVIPFRIDQAPLTVTMGEKLGHCHWIDATTSPMESHLKRLGSVIQSALSGQALSSTHEPLASGGVLARIDSAVPAVQTNRHMASVPQALREHGDFIFVSYKREDLPRITPFLTRICEWGYEIWYDRGIPGGAEWDALIEEKVSQCKVLLVFLSQARLGRGVPLSPSGRHTRGHPSQRPSLLPQAPPRPPPHHPRRSRSDPRGARRAVGHQRSSVSAMKS
jgi:hypothetical protein